MKTLLVFLVYWCIAGYSQASDWENIKWKQQWVCYNQDNIETIRVDSSWVTINGIYSEWIQVVIKDQPSIDFFKFLNDINSTTSNVILNNSELIIQFRRMVGDSNGCFVGSSERGFFSMYGAFGCKGANRIDTVTIQNANNRPYNYEFGNYGGYCQGEGF